MTEKLTNRMICLTMIFGIFICSNVWGGHLPSSSPHSGPPPIQQPKQSQKQEPFSYNNLEFFPLAGTDHKPPTLKNRQVIPTDTDHRTPRPNAPAKSGWQLLLDGQTQEAMNTYRQVIQHNPQSANAYLGLGITLKIMGKNTHAEKALLKAVNLNPRSPSALVHLGYLYAEGGLKSPDLAKARQLFQQAKQLGDPFASIALLDMQSRAPL